MTARRCICCLLLALAACAPSWADVLDAVSPRAVVCVGNNAPDEEQEAARLLFQALRKRSHSVLFLSDEQVLGCPLAESGRWHVVAVGRATTNSVLLAYPSCWALDRELHYAPLGHMPAAPFTETRGFYVGGFGYFFAGRNVGFVEFDRSPFFSAMLLSPAGRDGISGGANRPPRFLIRITGSTPEGVLLGARRLVETGMLYGVAIGPPRWPRSHDIWNLDDERIKPDPPGWIPKGVFRGAGGDGNRMSLSFLGWLMADRTMYAGFLEITGCEPEQMWRAKYETEVGLTDFHRSPHHRASGNELLVVKLKDPQDSTRALKKLGGTIPVRVGGRTWYRTSGSPYRGGGGDRNAGKESIRAVGKQPEAPTHMLVATVGDAFYLILANFEKGYVEMIINELARSLGKEQ